MNMKPSSIQSVVTVLLPIIIATLPLPAMALYDVTEAIGPTGQFLKNGPTTITDTFDFVPPSAFSGSELHATGSADLSSGELKIRVESNTPSTVFCCDQMSSGAVGYGDTLLYTGLSAPISVALLFTVDGLNNQPFANSQTGSYGRLLIYRYADPDSFDSGVDVAPIELRRNYPFPLTFSYTLNIIPRDDGTAAAAFQANLLAVAASEIGFDSIVDFSHTVRLSIDSPVPFTSASGVLLTNPVPLPAAVWLFSFAIGALGLSRRRFR